MAWLTNEELTEAVSSVMGENPAGDAAPSHRTEIIAACLRKARSVIVSKMVKRGYTVAQAAAWDLATDCHRSLALCMINKEFGIKGGQSNAALEFYCKEAEEMLKEDVTVDGVPVTPAGTRGTVLSGVLDTAGDVFGPGFTS